MVVSLGIGKSTVNRDMSVVVDARLPLKELHRHVQNNVKNAFSKDVLLGRLTTAIHKYGGDKCHSETSDASKIERAMKQCSVTTTHSLLQRKLDAAKCAIDKSKKGTVVTTKSAFSHSKLIAELDKIMAETSETDRPKRSQGEHKVEKRKIGHATKPQPSAQAKSPPNRLFSHSTAQRLIRDSAFVLE